MRQMYLDYSVNDDKWKMKKKDSDHSKFSFEIIKEKTIELIYIRKISLGWVIYFKFWHSVQYHHDDGDLQKIGDFGPVTTTILKRNPTL